MSKKGKHAAHADERWLLTYADMITLLMALFIVMFSISVVNTGKFNQLAQSMKESFSGDVMSGNPSLVDSGAPNFNVQQNVSPSEAAEVPVPEASSATHSEQGAQEAARAALAAAKEEAARQEKQLEAAQQAVDQKVAQLGYMDEVITTIDERGLVIRLVTDDVLFGSGSSVIESGADPLLRVVAQAIDPLPLPIHVEGHTDANPFEGDPLGNFKLSIDRGKSVAVFLLENGVHPEHHRGDVTGTGYGDYNPLPGVDPLDPSQRRVEIVIVRRDFVAEAEKAVSGPIGANPIGVAPLEPVQSGDIAPSGAVTTSGAADASADEAAAVTAP